MKTGMAVMSFTTEIWRVHHVNKAPPFQSVSATKTYHLKPHVGIPSRDLSRWTVNSGLFACALSSLQNPGNRLFQFRVEISHHRVSDVVAQVPGPDEEDVDTIDSCNGLDLDNSCVSSAAQLLLPPSTRHSATHTIQSLLRLNLHNRQEIVICILHIVEPG